MTGFQLFKSSKHNYFQTIDIHRGQPPSSPATIREVVGSGTHTDSLKHTSDNSNNKINTRIWKLKTVNSAVPTVSFCLKY